MKRKLMVAAMLLLVIASVSAGFDYRLDLLSFDPIYKEYTADRDRAGLDFQWLYVDQFPEGVYQNGLYFEFMPFGHGSGLSTDGFDTAPWMAISHLGETLSLGRNTFSFDHWLSPISFDFSLQGSMIIGMEGGMADMIGYDGVFFYGATASIADRVSMRIGCHHYCTHYGDGTLKMLGLDRNGHDFDPSKDEYENFTIFKKYIRMEALAVGLSVVPYDGIRLYGELNMCISGLTDEFDTMIFSPHWRDDEHLVQNKDKSYNSLIANFGIELSYPIFRNLGMTTLSYDCHAYEEGRIIYRAEDLKAYDDFDSTRYRAYYDRKAPWEFEHEIVLSQEINDLVSFELGYHHGRFPLNSLYHQKCNYVYVGARVNPGATVTIFDTDK